MSYPQAQNVKLPEPCKRGPSRWLIPLGVGFGSLLLGFGLGVGGGKSESSCTELTDEYAALVSDGLDAGLSGDETLMFDVVAQRDELSARVKNSC